LIIMAAGGVALAQTAPKAAPKAPPKAAPKQAPAQPPQQQAQQQQPQITFTPWTKLCQKTQDATPHTVCVTGRDGRAESGMPVAAAMLIEPEGGKKVLRITLPLGMALPPGTRAIVDQGQPMTGPYVVCFANGCVSDYEASEELIDKMKKGQVLVLQGINGGGQAISLGIPLADFAKVHGGPPMDPKVFEEQQKKLMEELQRKQQQAQQQH
jgi:invasion protein IalB